MVDIFFDANLLDIGYGKPVRLSSNVGTTTPPPHLVPSSDPGSPFFRTHWEEGPSITVDLRSVRHVQRIRVFNNETEAERGVPLAVSLSVDGEAWFDIFLMEGNFGGKLTGSPLVITLSPFALCRYVRLQTRAHTSLRLHYIEICAPLPTEYLGKLRNIRVTETDVLADYWHHDSYGFAWTFTCTLGMILNARLLGVTIDRIDYSLCLREFKDDPDQDAYAWLFENRPRRQADQPAELPVFERHGVYVSFPLDVLRAYAELYFQPHPRVLAFADLLVATYGLDLSNTVVLLYRGTDKAIEITPAAPERYAAVASALLAQEPGLTVLCQTDQAQAREAIALCLPQTIWFSELPVTAGDRAIHNLDVASEFELTKAEMALRLLAMTSLVACAKYVVTHTGNLGAWVAIYRGRRDGLYQFCEDGRLRNPAGNVVSLDLAPPSEP